LASDQCQIERAPFFWLHYVRFFTIGFGRRHFGEDADSAVEQVLSAYKDCVRVVGRDLLAEVKGLMPANQQSV
jgi:hypothetical protein